MGSRDLASCHGEHRGRVVDSSHLVAELDQAARVAPGAAGHVEDSPGRKRIEDGPHRGLLEGDDRVVGLVVVGRPDAVAGAGVGLGHCLAGLELAAIENAAHLGQALLGVGVGAVVEMAEQGQPLDAHEQLAQSDAAGHERHH